MPASEFTKASRASSSMRYQSHGTSDDLRLPRCGSDLVIAMRDIDTGVDKHKREDIDSCRGDMQRSHRFIIDSTSTIRVIWDVMSFSLIVSDLVLIPVEVCFDVNRTLSDSFFFIDVMKCSFFSLDVCVNCLTAYVKSNGLPVRRQTLILQNYFLRWPYFAFLDIASLVPFLLIFVVESTRTASTATLARATKLQRFVRTLRLLRVFRAFRFSVIFQERFVHNFRIVAAIIEFAKLIFIFCVIAHFGACFWRATSNFEEQAADVNVDPGVVWESYLLAAWWMVSTLAASEPPTAPADTKERVIWGAMSLLSVAVISLGLGALVQMLDALSDEQKEFKRKMSVAQRFLSTHDVPPLLRAKVLAAIRVSFNMKERRGNFQQLVEPMLSRDLVHQLHGNIYGDIIKRFPPFAEPSLPDKFRYKLAYEANSHHYGVNDLILEEGKTGDTMIFILDGIALLHSTSQAIVLPRVTKGWWLGEKVVFWNKTTRSPVRAATCVAILPCTTLEICVDNFLAAVEEFKLRAWLERMRDKSARGEAFGCPACGGLHWVQMCNSVVLDEDASEAEGSMPSETSTRTTIRSLGDVASANYARFLRRGTLAEWGVKGDIHNTWTSVAGRLSVTRLDSVLSHDVIGMKSCVGTIANEVCQPSPSDSMQQLLGREKLSKSCASRSTRDHATADLRDNFGCSDVEGGDSNLVARISNAGFVAGGQRAHSSQATTKVHVENDSTVEPRVIEVASEAATTCDRNTSVPQRTSQLESWRGGEVAQIIRRIQLELREIRLGQVDLSNRIKAIERSVCKDPLRAKAATSEGAVESQTAVGLASWRGWDLSDCSSTKRQTHHEGPRTKSTTTGMKVVSDTSTASTDYGEVCHERTSAFHKNDGTYWGTSGGCIMQ
eukprot:TRINITY_DN5159_c0_g1_i1.p1 TRINITY_DN5159_c0_g1~~TRINITY_DN5159_c0_g1_i1.p1  ORF type:complete len:922 (+),score=111.12 TRINITY_DN5159_c0_g1_i1:91-2766(+)